MTSPVSPPRRPLHKRLARLLVLAVGCYLVIALLFVTLQRSLIYPALVTGPLKAAEFRPPTARMDDVTTTTEDGLTLHGWHVRPDTDAGPRDRPVILIFHGNGGHRAQGIEDAEFFASAGVESLLFDYRGYAENPGKPTEEGLAADARAVWRYATETLRVPPNRILIYGESLGGGVSARLAADLSKQGTTPAGLALLNTFTSLVDAASYHYPWLPVRLALLDRFESERRIANVTCPILILHGDRDAVIPQRFGRRLFDAAPEQSASNIAKRFVNLPGANHNDALDVARGPLTDALAAFLRQTTGPEPTANAK